MKKLLGAVAVVAALTSAPAQAGCWTNAAYEAAQVRDFETMMMVSMLRCRISGVNFTETYNQFVRDKRPVLNAVNNELRDQFAQTVGRAQAMGAYDNYMTKVANGYGGGAVGMNCADVASIADAAVVAAPTRSALVDLARRAGSSPQLPGCRCPASIAMQSGK